MKPNDTSTPAKKKKPYRRPVLHVYGDIRAITRAVGTTGLADGGNGQMKRTR